MTLSNEYPRTTTTKLICLNIYISKKAAAVRCTSTVASAVFHRLLFFETINERLGGEIGVFLKI